VEDMEAQEYKTGILHLVSTPIGNYADLTIRAYNTLRDCDFVICEEFKEASKLLRYFELKKELRQLDEHNETEIIDEYISELLSGKEIALISDCGTPVFADPGLKLLNRCRELNIKLNFIPGANSVLAAIVLSGFDISRFYYLGFLSPKSDIRKKELKELISLSRTFVILDTPYRLKTVLSDIEAILPERDIFIGFNLTMEDEIQFRGTAKIILEKIRDISGDENFKGEYVIVVSKEIIRHTEN
jgi:16S rRNA (cytidine1402-2'-O)-methyltransferase